MTFVSFVTWMVAAWVLTHDLASSLQLRFHDCRFVQILRRLEMILRIRCSGGGGPGQFGKAEKKCPGRHGRGEGEARDERLPRRGGGALRGEELKNLLAQRSTLHLLPIVASKSDCMNTNENDHLRDAPAPILINAPIVCSGVSLGQQSDSAPSGQCRRGWLSLHGPSVCLDAGLALEG